MLSAIDLLEGRVKHRTEAIANVRTETQELESLIEKNNRSISEMEALIADWSAALVVLKAHGNSGATA